MVKYSRRDIPGAHALLDWTINILRRHNVRPSKKLSQNFVVDPDLINEVLSHIDQGEDVLEIGCGIGTLTRFLISKSRRVYCIEIDPRLAMITSEEIDDPRVIVVRSDALKAPITLGVVVSNVPYHITSELLVRIARENNVEKAILTLQYEVAERLLARPGSKKYGRITILIRNLFDVERGAVYPPSSFYPKPEVHSQLVVLKRKRKYDEVVQAMEEVTRRVFSQRRRLVDKVLEETLNISVDLLGDYGEKISGMRVYAIPPETWLSIAERLLDLGVIKT